MSTIATPSITAPPDEPLFEIIDGNKIEVPPMSAYANIVASTLLGQMANYFASKDTGRAVMETLFNLEAVSGRHRRPDVAFVSYDRWAKDKPISYRQNAWNVTPDLAVEIVSPTDFAVELMDKLEEYSRAGVRQMWVVYPQRRFLQAYRSMTEIEVFDRSSELVCDDLLPGFRLKLASLFPAADDNA